MVSVITTLDNDVDAHECYMFCIHVSDDTALFYGIKFYNDVLMAAGPDGNLQSELILEKDAETFTFTEGWAFPRKIYFNGDECMMPPPDAYPYLPNTANPILRGTLPKLALNFCLLATLVFL